MEIRDVIHGTILLSQAERILVESPFFQRLRSIKQLGFGEQSFPSATHTRFSHSLGAMHLAGQAFDFALGASTGPSFLTRYPEAATRLRACVRAAALLHDIGHGPLSHTTEFAMPHLDALGFTTIDPGLGASTQRQATHEDYTLKILLESSFTPTLHRALGYLGITPLHVASLIDSKLPLQDDFFIVGGTDYRPLLQQFVSSELDVDRMDYLRRDSFYTGVPYGKVDLLWLLSHLTVCEKDGKAYLALKHQALYAFDDFLLSRFHMYLMVYFHHKCILFDEYLERFLKEPDCSYQLPSDIEEYIRFDDHHLNAYLAQSKNPWAQAIAKRRTFPLIAEFHSGIPQDSAHREQQRQDLNNLLRELQNQGIEPLVLKSQGKLSKYYERPEKTPKRVPMFIHYDTGAAPAQFIPLEECTDLYAKYSEARSITRVYIPPEASYRRASLLHPADE